MNTMSLVFILLGLEFPNTVNSL